MLLPTRLSGSPGRVFFKIQIKMCDESKQLEMFEDIPDTERVSEIETHEENINIHILLLRELSTQIKPKNDE